MLGGQQLRSLHESQRKYNMILRDMDEKYGLTKQVWDRYHHKYLIDERKYYEGFNVGREKEMFKEELEDLEIVYKKEAKRLHHEVEEVLPSLLWYMERFVKLHGENEKIRCKLDALLCKTGREHEIGDDMEEDNE